MITKRQIFIAKKTNRVHYKLLVSLILTNRAKKTYVQFCLDALLGEIALSFAHLLPEGIFKEFAYL